MIRYSHVEYVNKTQKRTARYVAFVVAGKQFADSSGIRITRVELGEASAIDDAVRQWRHDIENRRDDPKMLSELNSRVWAKLAPAIPAGTTLYLALDGDLARMPWVALPIDDGRILLEDHAVAMVPHGTFLLDQLRSSTANQPREPGKILLAGGVDYGMGVWPKLPGTVVEINAIDAVAPSPRDILTGLTATPAKVAELLPKSRVAHLATHGFFNADVLAAEKKRAEKALASRVMGDESRRIAAKNPLGYVGLVLANGEVITGLAIVDLPLAKTQLVTLSACETGLGELTGGEGTQGLQRAFHLAGCPNVLATLWNVNDKATAALMAKFYHELWITKKPPIEALREAQLTIYRRPDLIADFAGERGAPKLKEAVAVKPNPSGGRQAGAAGEPRRADARPSQLTPIKLWAAFVMSGVGN